MRRKPWAEKEIKENPDFVVPNPEEWKGRWHHFFGNDQAIHIEIGSGKGQFIVNMAKTYPHINFIGIEIQTSVLAVAVRKLKLAKEEFSLSNICLIRENAARLKEVFASQEVERIYLNFSDPWPKRRHAKRRLTHPAFLDVYSSIIKRPGEIHLKTDNEAFFEYSLNSFADYGCRLRNISFNLHESDFENNIMTEYEEKFAQLGKKIYRCEAIML
jgi:tRNA (guanine-N7-)-methyltransferase